MQGTTSMCPQHLVSTYPDAQRWGDSVRSSCGCSRIAVRCQGRRIRSVQRQVVDTQPTQAATADSLHMGNGCQHPTVHGNGTIMHKAVCIPAVIAGGEQAGAVRRPLDAYRTMRKVMSPRTSTPEHAMHSDRCSTAARLSRSCCWGSDQLWTPPLRGVTCAQRAI